MNFDFDNGSIHNRPTLSNNKRHFPTISYSEISTFNACRMKHHYTYKLQLERQQYEPKPIFGSMGHAALEALYAGKDWRSHLLAFTENEIARQEMFEDVEPLFYQMADLVEAIVSRYEQHYSDDGLILRPISVEQKFEAVLPKMGRALGGFWDVLRVDQSGHYWIHDYKFVGGKVETGEDGQLRFKGGGQFRNDWELDMDIQLALYQWAAISLGIPVIGTIYDQIKAAIPKMPELLKNGKALSRSRITTDWDTYLQAINEHGFDVSDYIDVHGWASQTEYFRRTKVIRQPEELEGIIADVILKVKEIKRNSTPTRSPSRMNCGTCQFKELCLDGIRGRDIQPMIQDSFQPRSRRSDQLQLEDDEEEVEF